MKPQEPGEEGTVEIPAERTPDSSATFSIDPVQGMLPADGTANFLVTFAPAEVYLQWSRDFKSSLSAEKK